MAVEHNLLDYDYSTTNYGGLTFANPFTTVHSSNGCFWTRRYGVLHITVTTPNVLRRCQDPEYMGTKSRGRFHVESYGSASCRDNGDVLSDLSSSQKDILERIRQFRRRRTHREILA